MRGLPLSYHQSRLWFESQRAPESTAYNIPFHYRLSGLLDITRLERCLQKMTSQQESLRTYFDQVEPKQYILPSATVHLEYLDWRHENTADKILFLEKSILAFNQTLLSMADYPLSRYRVIQLEEESFVFSMLWHHLIMDGRSVSLWMQQLTASYRDLAGESRGGILHPVDNAYTMAKYLAYEAEILTPSERQRRRHYWSNQLSGLKTNTSPLGEEIDSFRTAGKERGCVESPLLRADLTPLGREASDHACRRLYHKTSPLLSKAIRKFIHDTNSSLFIIIAAALNAIMYRRNKQEYQLISYSVNTRPQAARDYYGFFVNNIPLRIKTTEHETFYDLVQRVMQQRQQDKLYQDTPLMDILSVVREENPNWEGTFDQVAINQVTSRTYTLQLEGIKTQLIPVEIASVRMPFTLLYDDLDVIEFEFEYDVTRYTDAFVEQFAQEFYAFLEDVLKNPNQYIATTTQKVVEDNIAITKILTGTKIDLVTPRNSTEYRVLKLFEQVLQRNNIGIEDKFFSLGGNSLMVIDLVTKIQAVFQKEISLQDVLRQSTVEGIAALLTQESKTNLPMSPLFRLNEKQSESSLVCVHPAGGTAFCYLPLVNACAASVAAYGIQSPGIEDDNYEVPSLTAVAEEYVQHIQANSLKNITLLGWSLGGLIAIEMAHQFAKIGTRIERVVLLDTTAPSPACLAQVKETSLAEFYSKLVRFNGIYPNIQDEQIHRYYKLYNALTLALKQYHLTPYDGDVIYFRSHSSETTVKEWKTFITGNVTVITHEVDHWNFMSRDSVKVIAQQLDRVLGREQYVNTM